MNTYDKGDLVQLTAAFTDKAGAAFDPSTVTFKLKDPTGEVTTYVYGTDAELVKDETGKYHVDVAADLSGDYHYRFQGSGLIGKSAAENTFRIRASLF